MIFAVLSELYLLRLGFLVASNVAIPVTGIISINEGQPLSYERSTAGETRTGQLATQSMKSRTDRTSVRQSICSVRTSCCNVSALRARTSCRSVMARYVANLGIEWSHIVSLTDLKASL